MDGKWLVGRLVVVVGDDSPLLFGSLWWGPLCCCRVTDGAPDWSHHHQTHTGSALSSSGQTFLLKGSQPENFDKFFFSSSSSSHGDRRDWNNSENIFFVFVSRWLLFGSFRNWPFLLKANNQTRRLKKKRERHFVRVTHTHRERERKWETERS